ncbi:helix-turn-helix domain-containing protein [Streptomyces sp. J2-1]|uniref:helix-turn-helix domain-containing protein n=1 Tax=Streptomyces corallincola TaxID=2851888 RepID=UPI001C395183|nr:helix-turn-helix transcriptional regulator [Streptomyces corallincola]MBV2354759.1 helix-turn-helix domain-containing protein [Streptomyces corallincola]
MEADGTEPFAELLRELKDRSGLSYGVLAKRLHLSTSTLHRYCNGSAVPVDYAPVERLARLCRATPEELVELHRRWIVADAARGKRGQQQGGAGAAAPTATAPGEATATVEPVPPVAPKAPNATTAAVGRDVEAGATPTPRHPRARHPRPRRRTALLSGTAVAVVLGVVALAVGRPWEGGAGAAGAPGADGTARTAIAGRPVAGASAGERQDRPSPSDSASRSAPPSHTAGTGAPKHAPRAPGRAPDTVPLAVATRPYVYEQPCSQHFLVNQEPAQVGPPASEQDAPRWAAAYGAVSSGEQRVALTVQGTGEDTVVLEALHVRVLGRSAPLAWNDYAMGVGCGGGVGTKSFDIALDSGSPTVTVKNGQRDFPYKVSESDPEVFYIDAHTTAHDVRWDLSLDWSSGTRHGTVHLDNAGTPFRTSADVGRPGYDYPLGGSEWTAREEQPEGQYP